MENTKFKDGRFRLRGRVKMFSPLKHEKPWVYVGVPRDITRQTQRFAERGLTAIDALLGKTEWRTSLMPMGDGTQFVPLSKKIRAAEKIEVGDRVTVLFAPRRR